MNFLLLTDDSLVLALLVGQNKYFKDDTLGLCEIVMILFTIEVLVKGTCTCKLSFSFLYDSVLLKHDPKIPSKEFLKSSFCSQ